MSRKKNPEPAAPLSTSGAPAQPPQPADADALARRADMPAKPLPVDHGLHADPPGEDGVDESEDPDLSFIDGARAAEAAPVEEDTRDPIRKRGGEDIERPRPQPPERR